MNSLDHKRYRPRKGVRFYRFKHQKGNVLLRLSISWRLSLGFLCAAIIAGMAAGAAGIQRTETVSRQADFYQNLLTANTDLLRNTDLLDEILSKNRKSAENSSNSTIPLEEGKNDSDALIQLLDQFEENMGAYSEEMLLDKTLKYQSLFSAIQQSKLVEEQRTRTEKAMTTWKIFRNSVEQSLQYITAQDILAAQSTIRTQVEPAHLATSNELYTLAQFNDSLAKTISDSADEQARTEFFLATLGAGIAFLIVGIIGLLISRTFVKRLERLLEVTMAVERGDMHARISVVGDDEIARVSASTNAMLDTIVNLLEQTRRQHDALTNAAEHLFSELRMMSAGELRIGTSSHEDPVSMLTVAFNFTVARFRRFAQRVHATTEQLQHISRREVDRAEAVAQILAEPKQKTVRQQRSAPSHFGLSPLSGRVSVKDTLVKPTAEEDYFSDVAGKIQKAKGHIQNSIERLGLKYLSLNEIEQAQKALKQLNSLIYLKKHISGQGSSEITQKQQLQFKVLDAFLTGLSKEMYNILSTVETLSQVDEHFQALLHSLFQERTKYSSSKLTEYEMHIQRIKNEFVQEILYLASQLSTLSQELQNNVATLYLDGGDIQLTKEKA